MTIFKLRKVNTQCEVAIETEILFFKKGCEICWIRINEDAVIITLKDDFKIIPDGDGDLWIKRVDEP